jgi:hypothetical protein
MIGTAAPARGVGLALVLQKGLPAWIRAVRTCAGSSVSPANTASSALLMRADRDEVASISRGPRAELLPPAQYTEAVRLLAGLVLSARPLGHRTLTLQGVPR